MGRGGGGGGGIQPTPLYVRGLNDPRKKPALIIVGKTDCQKENYIPLPSFKRNLHVPGPPLG